MAYELALTLGEPNPDALLRDLSSRQISEWHAYRKIQPFGEQRMDYRFAVLVLVMMRLWGGEKSGDVSLKDVLETYFDFYSTEEEKLMRHRKKVAEKVKHLPEMLKG